MCVWAKWNEELINWAIIFYHRNLIFLVSFNVVYYNNDIKLIITSHIVPQDEWELWRGKEADLLSKVYG